MNLDISRCVKMELEITTTLQPQQMLRQSTVYFIVVILCGLLEFHIMQFEVVQALIVC
jgi:hypothetical protein